MPDGVECAPPAPATVAVAGGLQSPSFAPAVLVRNRALLFVSGQVALSSTGEVLGSNLAIQSEQAFVSLIRVLTAAQAGLRDVVQLRVYVVDLTVERRNTFLAVQHRHLGGHRPAHTLVGVVALARPGLVVELEAIAAVPPASQPPAWP